MAIKILNSILKKFKNSDTRTLNVVVESVLKIQRFSTDTTLYLKDEQDLDVAMAIQFLCCYNRA